ncbi:pseudaminic acid synthase [Cohaesibacter sp. CAU 1516]|uniref:pseudaminic acid synthase n=1 Tax=Cohaesibacter sp. CAU 1516 TaxID=2576038 RepID=UPI0010FF0D11|nr:pseudaminic acid synthase [Cohaesibacter sp. CAU 1516]TLP42096.1 pseudaminic acid synthase [Cohaesibacter sp. CAU 1516]
MKQINIDQTLIGDGHSPYIIAEMSGNHNGDIKRAIALIHAAKEAGANAVKLQTYRADTITINHDGPEFYIDDGLWKGNYLYQLYEQAHTPWEWHECMFEEAKRIGITIFSSPFDFTAVDFLDELGAPAFKIASFELIDLPLIRKTAEKMKPIILSTGNASLAEIEEAVQTVRNTGNNDLVLLHCTSGYPTPAREANLSSIKCLADNFDCLAGLSDHTMGFGVSVASVALGASVIEKHFTLARSDGGPDSEFSLEKGELSQLVAECKNAFDAIGKPNFISTQSEAQTKPHRRSLYVVKDIAKGECFTEENIRSIRPGKGLRPRYYYEVLGCVAKQDITRGTALSWDLIG